ncbi:beta-propeller domain-containing protein [bacterium]|nr:beta-propeller domain-containing protein [bacterium]
MDEDSNGNFRILTRVFENESYTNLYVLDKNLSLAGKLEKIEPGEEFKSSRYIGDKLYLVTFEQIDPLFVIDIADITNPKILGELEIP